MNVKVARRSLGLMEQHEERLQPTLQLFHLDSYLKRIDQDSYRIYAVEIGISCSSDTSDSIKDLSLRMDYKPHESEIVSNIEIPNMANITNEDIEFCVVDANSILNIPRRLESHESIRGWGLFKVRETILSNSDIKNYQIIIKDTHNSESIFEIKVIQERGHLRTP